MAHAVRQRRCRTKSRRRMENAMAPTGLQCQPKLDDQTNGPKLQPGQILQSQWRVERLLSKGSFGVVYEAVDVNGSSRVAVKTEPIVTKLPLLRIELAVMIAIQGRSNRVTTLYSAGHTHDLNYIVMSLLGKTLMELKKATPDDRFKLPTVLRVAKEMLISLCEIHNAGFLHRDVKPSNFAVEHELYGNANRGLIYIFDFGLCRQYVNPNTGCPRDARQNVPFRGTVRYASVDVLSGKDMGRHDDLWSLFYILAEMLNSQLPWRKVPEKDKVKAIKQSTTTSELWRNFPPETRPFVQHLQQLHFYDPPHYLTMIAAFDAALVNAKITDDMPYDWEKLTPTTEPITTAVANETVDNEDDKSLASQKSEEEQI